MAKYSAIKVRHSENDQRVREKTKKSESERAPLSMHPCLCDSFLLMSISDCPLICSPDGVSIMSNPAIAYAEDVSIFFTFVRQS